MSSQITYLTEYNFGLIVHLILTTLIFAAAPPSKFEFLTLSTMALRRKTGQNRKM